jgi:hypothetical protein
MTGELAVLQQLKNDLYLLYAILILQARVAPNQVEPMSVLQSSKSLASGLGWECLKTINILAYDKMDKFNDPSVGRYCM